jgi:signal transduction histidine kinase/CheY-like chemotaxis protein
MLVRVNTTEANVKDGTGEQLVVLSGAKQAASDVLMARGGAVASELGAKPSVHIVKEIVLSGSAVDEKTKHEFNLARALSEFSESVADVNAECGENINRVISVGCRHLGLDAGVLSRIINGECRLPSNVVFGEAEKSFAKLIARYVSNELMRDRMKSSLRYRTEFEKLVLEISRDFINLAIEQVDDGIKSALRKIADFAGVDLSYIFLFKDNDTKMDITHWWAADDLKPKFRLKDVQVKKYSWVTRHILNRQVAFFTDLEAIPPEAAAEKRFAEGQGIKSAIIVPMIYSGACIGLVGFASRREKKTFDEGVVNLLKMVGHILASAVEYKRSQESVRNLEAQMLHAQKLESLGVLAGGIAHDFNNLLMSILGNATTALRDLPQCSSARTHIGRIEKTAQHAAELTNRLLAYAGKGKCFVEVLNLSGCVKEMMNLLGPAVSKKTRIVCNFANDLPTIEGDATQISQVIMNLVTNASDALDDRNGTITIGTGLVAVDRKYLMGTYLSDDTPEGVYVYLRVTDTGCGMSKETISRIFDPFYTTKATGRGLGLAAVLGIVRSHRGTIKVRSIAGEGSTFTVLFPCSATQNLPATGETKYRKELRGKGRILVIDDEQAVLDVVAEMIQHSGFDVVKAQNGREALAAVAKDPQSIDAAVVDMTMPDMSGEVVCRELLNIHRNLKIVLTSGYSEQHVRRQCEDQVFTAFIQKPYPPEVLVGKLVNLLNGENGKNQSG